MRTRGHKGGVEGFWFSLTFGFLQGVVRVTLRGLQEFRVSGSWVPSVGFA